MTLVLSSVEFASSSKIYETSSTDYKVGGWFELIPITAPYGLNNYYEPTNPLPFDFINFGPLSRLSIQLKDGKTGGFMRGIENNDKWEMMLRVITYSIN
jgi:hypothetical protein